MTRRAKRREIRHQGAPRRRVGRALDDPALSQASRQLERAVCGAWVAKESEVGDVLRGRAPAPKPLHATHAARAPPSLCSTFPGPERASSSHPDQARHRTSRSGGWGKHGPLVLGRV